MPITLVDFWKRLIASGLTDASTPRAWAASYAQDHNATPPTDSQKLAKWLVATARLRPFQASGILRGSPDIPDPGGDNNSARVPKLRILPVTQAQESADPAFPRWLAVARDPAVGNTTGDPTVPQSGLLFQIDPSRLTPDDGDRLRQLAAIDTTGLASFELMGLTDGPLGLRATSMPIDRTLDTIGLFSPLPPGRTLAAAISDQPKWSATKIVAMVRSIAGPVREASRLSVSAPRNVTILSSDRVWLSASQPDQTLFWIDPVEHLSDAVCDFDSSIRRTESELLYTAPEILRAGRTSVFDERSVIYSLGCLVYRLTTGSHAFAAATDDEIRSRQFNYDPPELVEAARLGVAGDPMFRVLGYALAKDPAGRFDTIDQFIAAIQAVPETEPATSNLSSQKPERRPAESPVQRVASESKANGGERPPRATSAAPEDGQAATRINPPPTASPAAPAQPAPANASGGFPATLSPASILRRQQRRKTTWYVLNSLWIPIVLLVLLNALQGPPKPRPIAKRMRPAIPTIIPSVGGDRRSDPPPVRPRTDSLPPTSVGSTNATSDRSQRSEQTVRIVQDGTMLWADPASIKPSDAPENRDAKKNDGGRLDPTTLLPPGPAAIITIDYPNLVATGLPDTFDPEIVSLLDALQKRIVVPLDDVRLIAMAWFPGVDGVPRVAVAVHLKEPQNLESLAESWGVSEAVGPGGATLFASDEPDGFAYYPAFSKDGSVVPASMATADQGVTAFAVGSIEQIGEVADVAGSPVLFPRQLEELWRHTRPGDAIALLTQPNFLVADARAWVDALAPPLLDWIRSILTPECGGVLLRVVRTDDSGTYVEIRLAVAPGMSPVALREKMVDRLDKAPTSADDFLVSSNVDPSWRLLAARLPTMWAFVSDQTRSLIDDRQVIFNAYLPPAALPQITLATLLASNTTGTMAASGTAPKTEKLTVAEMLDRPMSISFGQESMQFAVDTITTEFNDTLPDGNKMPPVEIIGGDLQLMGITQNQQIRDFAKQNLPLRQVLTDLVLGANPDKTATGPADPKQALVWVVVGTGDDAKIYVTTRQASKGKYDLPKEFSAP